MHQHGGLKADQVRIPQGSAWGRLPLVGGALALLGLGAAALLARGQSQQFFFSYLVAFLFWLSLALGGLFFVLVQFAARAGWSVVVRRAAEQVMGTLPLFMLLFIPLGFGLHDLYHWTHPEAVAGDHLLQHKRPYLNEGFFLARAAFYLLVWSGLGWWYRRRSLQQDASGDFAITRRLQAVSGPALILYAVTVTFAAFDWAMSVDPHWFSTLFGVYFFSGSALGLFALLALLAVGLRWAKLTQSAITPEHLHDLGKLLFAFVCFWAYIAFSQFMLYWYANIPEETAWYLTRLSGGWGGLSAFLALGHFVLPFFFLLPRGIKRSSAALVLASLWTLAMHYLDLYWLIMPALHPVAPSFGLLDLCAMIGVGGVFFAGLGWQLRRAALVPVGDPRLPESLSFENV